MRETTGQYIIFFSASSQREKEGAPKRSRLGFSVFFGVLDSGVFNGKASTAAKERHGGEGKIRERKGVKV